MAPQPIHILPRGGDASSNIVLYIAGFSIAGVVILGAATWLAIRFLKQRARRNDEDNRGAAFLNVRGLVREAGEKGQGEGLPKYGYQCSSLMLDTPINCVLTTFFYRPTIVISTASKAICSQGPIWVLKESSCLAVLSPGRTLQNRKS